MQELDFCSSICNKAPSHSIALFVSDLHLQSLQPRTTEAFIHFLKQHAIQAKKLYILGDLFEYWAGDDDMSTPLHQQIIHELRKVSDAGTKIFWVAGNRDFLVGEKFAVAASITCLPEVSITTIAGRCISLAHGDALCTDDLSYMDFRKQVRNAGWQKQFLALPLAQRKSIIEELRNGSRTAQRTKSYEIMDVNEDAIQKVFEATNTSILIHGHTHRPARHEYCVKGDIRRVRYVLPDWDCDSPMPRGGWLALDAAGDFKLFSYNSTEINFNSKSINQIAF